MSFDGGFGAAVHIREGLINGVVKAMHFRHGDAFCASVSRTLPLDGVSVAITGSLYVEAPHVALRAADGKARVALTGWARLRLQAPGTDEACLARLTAELLVPIAIDEAVDGWPRKVYLDLSRFDVLSAIVAVPWASPAPGTHAGALTLSDEFRKLLLDAVRPMAQKHLRINVPVEMLDQMMLNLTLGGVYGPNIRPKAVKVMDGALAVGFLQYTGVPEPAGNVDALEPPWAQWAARMREQGAQYAQEDDVQIVLAILPAVFLKWAGLNIKIQVKLRPSPDDKRVDDVVLGLVPGAATLLVSMTDINDDPFADDHLQILVSLVPLSQYIFIQSTQVVFISSGILGLIDLATGIVTNYVRAIAKERVGGAVREANWAFSMAKYIGELPGAAGSPGRATVRVSHEGTALDPGFVLAGVSARLVEHGDVLASADPTDNPDALPALRLTSVGEPADAFEHLWGGVPIRARHVRFDVPDHPALRRDPSLRTLWTVLISRQDGTTGEFIQDRWSNDAGARTLLIDLWSPVFEPADKLEVRCAHYRPPYGEAAELARSTVTFDVVDRFRRDFPYVRWHREIGWWQAMPDGRQEWQSKPRSSAVHKTDIRERCKFCDTGSNRPLGHDGMQHFSTLPPTAADGFRVKLCEYCFRNP